MKTINVDGNVYVSVRCANCPYYMKSDSCGNSMDKIGECAIERQFDHFEDVFGFVKQMNNYVFYLQSYYPQWCPNKLKPRPQKEIYDFEPVEKTYVDFSEWSKEKDNEE